MLHCWWQVMSLPPALRAIAPGTLLPFSVPGMTSKNVRVDSLFLDEGYGTLDEEALDTALETLAGLQQDGKLIGVISHVLTLKDRISTQIQVTPQTGGRSYYLRARMLMSKLRVTCGRKRKIC
ncbi:hypothetical protein [Desulfovibrio sp. TomC]|uniref:hypothetical protein n=1 Tax=Desulfovibrio sp. TomC TaxID=1562888 RepID=UPI001E344575|nr:hypothetical protein [Desulfovibrio sp. TomC]